MLPDLLEQLRASLEGVEAIEDGLRGRRRGVEVAFRLARHSSALRTQVDVVLARPKFHFALREQTEEEVIVLCSMVVSYCAGAFRGGGHVDPDDQASP